MADYAFSFVQASPLLRKYQVNATTSTAGVILRAPGANNAGVVLATTTSAADAVGLNLDTATYVTAQQSGSSAERTVTLIVDPMAVYRFKLSGAATENTALTVRDVTTASTDGLAVITGDDWSSPTMDEGVVWGYDGANAGQFRKITSVDTTTATVTVAFDNDTVVGDNFAYAPIWPLGTATVTFSTALTQVRQDAAVATNTAAMRCVGGEFRDVSLDGRTNSFVYLMCNDHIFNTPT